MRAQHRYFCGVEVGAPAAHIAVGPPLALVPRRSMPSPESVQLAVQYAQAGPRTLARDLNRLEGTMLIRKVGRAWYRAPIDQMSAFLPVIAPEAYGDT